MAVLRRAFSWVVLIGLVPIMLSAYLPAGEALAAPFDGARTARQAMGHGTVTGLSALSDGPVVTVPGVQSVVEDTPLFFGTVTSNAITVADAAASSGSVQLSVTAGTLTSGSRPGVVVSGSGSATVTVSGLLTEVNAALDGLVFTPAVDSNGSVTLTVVLTDPGGQTASGSVLITVSAFNDPPVNMVPVGIQAAVEDTPRVFSTISVTDVDAGAAVIQMTLSAGSGGTVTLPGTAGLIFSAGDGTTDVTMTFTGTVADIDAALAGGLVVMAPPNYVGPVALTVTSNDLGNTGAGPVGVDSDTVVINVAAVNDPPVNAVPGPQTTSENTAKVFSSAAGNPISVADLDAAAGVVQTTLTATSGTVTLSGTGGVVFTSGDGVADATMTFRGTVPGINAALDGLVFTPNPNFHGTAALTVITNDLGNTGSGGARTDADTVTITVTPVNDPPTTVGDAYTTVQQTPLAVPAPGVLGNDTDTDGTTLTAALGAGPVHGTVTLRPDGSFSYTPTTGFVGADTFTYTATDGTATSAPAPVTITVTAATCAVAPPGAIVGSAGNNTLNGTPGDDLIYGLGGNDTISGLGGNDLICGGPGNDAMSGGDGNDRMFGEAGNDAVNGNGGSDTLSGGDGNDALDGGAGTNSIDAGLGHNACRNPTTGPGCP